MSGKPFLARWWVRILLALLVLGAVLYLARNFLVRKGLEAGVTEVTGFPLAVDSFHLGLFDSRVDVRGMRLTNPPGFEDPRCMAVARLAGDLKFGSLFAEELRLEEIDLAMEEIVVVRNAAGETNLDRLKALAEGGEGGAPARKDGGKPAEAEPPSKPRKWRCDRLHLRLPRVVVVDYTSMKNGKPKTSTYDLKVDEVVKNVRGPKQVVRILVRKVLLHTPVKLLKATLESLTDDVGDAAGRALEGGAKDALGGILGGDGGKSAPPPPSKKAPPPPPPPAGKPGKKK